MLFKAGEQFLSSFCYLALNGKKRPAETVNELSNIDKTLRPGVKQSEVENWRLVGYNSNVVHKSQDESSEKKVMNCANEGNW